MIDCEKLHGRLRAICRGESGLPPETEAAYRALWEGQPVPEKKPDSLDCVHRGAHIGWVGCDSCGGKHVEFKLFSCPLHAQCVVKSSNIGKIRGCGSCGSRMAEVPQVV